MALPSGYKRLGYIESSGTQFINTNFQPTNNSRIVVDFESNTSGLKGLFGSRTSNDTAAFIMWLENPYVYPVFSSASSYNTYPINKSSTNNRFIYELNKNVATVDGTTITLSSGTFTSTNNLYLLTVNNGGTTDARMASGKLYSCQIYNNGTLVRDYIPVLNISTNKAGLYDNVGGVFYGNAGSGNFTYPTATSENKVMIDGTVYDITGGRTMVSGTNYDIDNGKVMIAGTVYEISFSLPVTTIVFNVTNANSTLNANSAYYILNGEKQTYAGTGGTIYSNETLQVYVSGSTATYNNYCTITLNGVIVKSGSGTYTVNLQGCKTVTLAFRTEINGTNWAKCCDITTT